MLRRGSITDCRCSASYHICEPDIFWSWPARTSQGTWPEVGGTVCFELSGPSSSSVISRHSLAAVRVWIAIGCLYLDSWRPQDTIYTLPIFSKTFLKESTPLSLDPVIWLPSAQATLADHSCSYPLWPLLTQTSTRTTKPPSFPRAEGLPRTWDFLF